MVKRQGKTWLETMSDEVLVSKGKLKGTKEGQFWMFRISDVEVYKKQLTKK
jgi:hypothetical protein